MAKYINGRTARTAERTIHKGLELPQITLCKKDQFNKEALNEMGLPQSFFVPPEETVFNKTFPDLNETFLRATYDFKLEYDIMTSGTPIL